MKSFGSKPRRRCRLWLAIVLASTALGCKDDPRPTGGLVVVLETDLSIPKDIDRIVLEFKQNGESLRSEDHEIGEHHLLIPARFRMPPIGNNDPVLVQATAYRGMEPRIERHAITPIPVGHGAALRLPFNYLCDGYAAPDGSSTCGQDMTCKQGTCAVASVSTAELPEVDVSAVLDTAMSGLSESDQTAVSASAGAIDTRAQACFDVLSCFANFVIAPPDADCTFGLPPGVDPERVNVALALPPGGAGICDMEGCWVPLDRGDDGWVLEQDQVRLPASVCRDRPDGLPYAIAVSSACAAKTAETPPCGSWASANVPIRAALATDLPPPAIGDACAGRPSESCGQCGTRTRSCRNGTWSPWSECAAEGVCTTGASQACGTQGTQICDASCQWGECTGQSCGDEAGTRSCDQCGTQTRSCDNGAWADWSSCDGQGQCASGDVRVCDNGGTQSCRGDCQWGECTDQHCPGPNTEPCGRCGTRTRDCDANSGQWSDWSACDGQGACQPDQQQQCGNGGSQVCGGDCQWNDQCNGQHCDAPLMQGCGACGVQVRACDPNNGQPGAWSACMNEGTCQPGATRGCGGAGLQTCGDDCRWGSDCVEVCHGPFSQTCGNCGMQTRSCDVDARKETPWSECHAQGACMPGQSRDCDFGVQRCGEDCQWMECPACPGDQPLMRACGNCGMQTRSCTSNGLSEWSACTGEGICMAGARDNCADGRQRTCTTMCQWDAECADPCAGVPLEQRCGNCETGKQARTCTAGIVSEWSPCRGDGECKPGMTQSCGDGGVGMQTCLKNCQWPAECTESCPATAPLMQACGNCNTGTQTRTCTANGLGEWSECKGGGECAAGATQTCMLGDFPGSQACSDTCKWGECGSCPTGAVETDSGCQCPSGQTDCDGRCVSLMDNANCLKCPDKCPAGTTCGGNGCQRCVPGRACANN